MVGCFGNKGLWDRSYELGNSFTFYTYHGQCSLTLRPFILQFSSSLISVQFPWCRFRQAGVYASYLFGPKGKQIKVSPGYYENTFSLLSFFIRIQYIHG